MSTLDELLNGLSDEGVEKTAAQKSTTEALVKSADEREKAMELMDMYLDMFGEEKVAEQAPASDEIEKQAAAEHQFGVDVGHIFNAMYTGELEKLAAGSGAAVGDQVKLPTDYNEKDTKEKVIADMKDKALAKARILAMLKDPVKNVPAGMTQGQPGSGGK